MVSFVKKINNLLKVGIAVSEFKFAILKCRKIVIGLLVVGMSYGIVYNSGINLLHFLLTTPPIIR